jgi:hypothetical protein
VSAHNDSPLRSVLLVAGAVALLGVILAGTNLLWTHQLLHMRAPVVAGIAVGAHSIRRRRPSILVAALHLVAIELCITDFMATGTWAISWGDPALLSLSTPAVYATLAVACSTALGFRRVVSDSGYLRRLWPLAIVTGVAGTALGRSPVPILAWTVAGTVISFLALVWAIDLYRAIGARTGIPVTAVDKLPISLSLWVVAASALLSAMIFGSVPHVTDEVTYWFHAKYFAAGYAWLPPPPDWNAFSVIFTINADGRWYSVFPPGWPAVLALGFLLHAPTLVNPVLAGATVLVLFRLLRRLYGTGTANVACLLLALSPAFLFMSAGVMSHPLAALCTVVAADRLHAAWAKRSRISAAIGGVALGLLTLTRPIEGVLVSLAFGVYMLSRFGWLRANKAIVSCFILFTAAITIGAILLPYNYMLTGSAANDPIKKYFDETYYPRGNRLGFGADVGNFGFGNDVLPGHSPLEAAINAHFESELVSLEMFGWPLGSLAAFVLYLAWCRRMWQPVDALFLSIALMTIMGHALYWYSGADYGARYWYQALIPVVVLSARALTYSDGSRPTLAPTALLLCLIGTFVFMPWRAVTKYIGYRGMGNSVVRLSRACDMTDGLVLVRDAMAPKPFSAYAMAGLLNTPGFAGHAPVFAREVSAEVTAKLQAAFPQRSLWIIQVPDDPRGDARILVGPDNRGNRPACGTDNGAHAGPVN